MNAITPQKPAQTLASIAISQPLDLRLRLMMRPDPHCRQAKPSQAEIAEARRLIPAAEDACKPVTRVVIERWLGMLNAAVRNPQGPQDFALKVSAVALACADLPAAVFTEDTLRQAIQQPEFRFFPAAGDVFEFLKPIAFEMTGRRDALRRVAATLNVGPEVTPWTPPTPDELTSVTAKLSAFRQEMSAKRSATRSDLINTNPAGSPRPLHSPPIHLLAAYHLQEMSGGHCAAIAKSRVGHLRKQLGVPDAAETGEWLKAHGIRFDDTRRQV